jgi:hypothetical protein
MYVNTEREGMVFNHLINIFILIDPAISSVETL